MSRCQICGRRKPVRANGTIVHHHVGGPRCPGAGYPPIEQHDARLVEYAAAVETAFLAACRAIRALEDRRANFIDPALIARRGALAGRSLQLSRRLRRHRDWPTRYRRSMQRQMERFGYAWSDPPPAYLIARETLADPCGEKWRTGVSHV